MIRTAVLLLQLPKMGKAFDMDLLAVKVSGFEVPQILGGGATACHARTFGAEPLFIYEFELSARVGGVFWAGRI